MLRFGGRDDGQLLVTSFEMVSLTLTIWTHQDRFAAIRRDFEWLVGISVVLLNSADACS